MARVYEDRSSWHAGGIIVRDKRQDKSSPEVARKSTKKGGKHHCKKNKGGPHTPVKKRSKRQQYVPVIVNGKYTYRMAFVTEWRCDRCDKTLRLSDKEKAALGDMDALNRLTCPHKHVIEYDQRSKYYRGKGYCHDCQTTINMKDVK